jgi:hypothetical protein
MTQSRHINAPRFRWTPEREQMLRKLYPDMPAQLVAQALGCSLGPVYSKAHLLGLHKSAAFLASQLSGRIQRGRSDPRMTATQFKPGVVPHNKGVPGSAGLHPNCRATQFKPGRKPQEARNYVPIGSHRLSKDGYLERKMTDDPALVPARRWKPVARLVWEAAHGPMPAGHAVVFKPGRASTRVEDITLDAVECITRAELMRRNTLHRFGAEVVQTIRMRARLVRAINSQEKEAA